MSYKKEFEKQLKGFVAGLQKYVSTDDGQWSIKGFIDAFKNVYTISSDTKIISKILEIHLFPKILEFAEENDYNIVLLKREHFYHLGGKEKNRNPMIEALVTNYKARIKEFEKIPAEQLILI